MMTEIFTPDAVEAPESESTSGKTRYTILGIGIILLVGLFAVFIWGIQERESIQLSGGSAPAFELTTFDGERIALTDLRGQVVVVNFWASWCVECYKEAALLEEAYQDFKDQGVIFLGVDYLDTEKEALEYMAKYGITYPSGQDVGTKISRRYQITGVPETFFIDRNGEVAHVQIGAIERPQLYQLLLRLAAGGTS
jgi:cytochrome c biogenesis protein CcmG/thiol:disulfide interchange protein DsbE